jgi:hypothetical protein
MERERYRGSLANSGMPKAVHAGLGPANPANPLQSIELDQVGRPAKSIISGTPRPAAARPGAGSELVALSRTWTVVVGAVLAIAGAVAAQGPSALLADEGRPIRMYDGPRLGNANDGQPAARPVSERGDPGEPGQLPESVREPQPVPTEVRFVYAGAEPAPDVTTTVLTQMAAIIGAGLVLFCLLAPVCVGILRWCIPAPAPVRVQVVGPSTPRAVPAAAPAPYQERAPSFDLGPTYQDEMRMRQESETRKERAVLEQLAAANVSLHAQLATLGNLNDIEDRKVPLAEAAPPG